MSSDDTTTDTTVTTDKEKSDVEYIVIARPIQTGLAAICMGIAFVLAGNVFLEQGIELIASADARGCS